jgi:SAM-dependent methyltransferase
VIKGLEGFDLGVAMRGLYATGAYYASIPAREVSYEEGYWGVIVDPDGKRRDRAAERDQHLSDLATELSYISELPGGRVLDIGCGLGFLLSALDQRWERYGIEVSAYAAERARSYGEIFTGPLLDCPFVEGSFDLVVMYHVIEHMDAPEANMIKLRKLLKPGGKLILGTPDFDSGCARRFGLNYRLLHDPTHVSLFSADSMHRFLRDHRFKIERVDFPYFGTRHFNSESLRRLFETDRISPPFYGNFMTFYCECS